MLNSSEVVRDLDHWLCGRYIELFGCCLDDLQRRAEIFVGSVISLKHELAICQESMQGLDPTMPAYPYIRNLVCSLDDCGLSDMDSFWQPYTLMSSYDFESSSNRLIGILSVNLHALEHAELPSDLSVKLTLKILVSCTDHLRMSSLRLSDSIAYHEPILRFVQNERGELLRPLCEVSVICESIIEQERAIFGTAEDLMQSMARVLPTTMELAKGFLRSLPELLAVWRGLWVLSEKEEISDEENLVLHAILKQGDFPFVVESFDMEMLKNLSLPKIDQIELIIYLSKYFQNSPIEQRSLILAPLRRLKKDIYKYLGVFSKTRNSWLNSAEILKSRIQESRLGQLPLSLLENETLYC